MFDIRSHLTYDNIRHFPFCRLSPPDSLILEAYHFSCSLHSAEDDPLFSLQIYSFPEFKTFTMNLKGASRHAAETGEKDELLAYASFLQHRILQNPRYVLRMELAGVKWDLFDDA